MEKIDFGLMLPGGIRINDENVNPTWKEHVRTREATTVAFVKILDFRKIYVECVCATIGRKLGLPIPRPMLVKVPEESLPDFINGKGTLLGFGSEDAKHPSFRRFFNSNSDYAIQNLIEFSKTLDIAIFDEWIGNWDRNIGNVLYDGGSEFYFIDHENAIDKSLKYDSPASRNQFLQQLSISLSEFEKHKLNKKSNIEIIPSYSMVEFSLISEKTQGGIYLSDDEVVEVIQFLENRLDSLTELVAKRWDFKQLGLNYE